MITMEQRDSCKFCGIKPKFYSANEYASYESKITVVDGGWATLYFGAEEDGTLFMSAAGEGETDHYRPQVLPRVRAAASMTTINVNEDARKNIRKISIFILT